jgi:Fe-S cluster assembly protein SufB
MIHISENTRSTIVSKDFAGHGQNTYRGLVRINKNAKNAATSSGARLAAHRRQVRRAYVPARDQNTAKVEHEVDVEDWRGQIFTAAAALRRKTRST